GHTLRLGQLVADEPVLDRPQFGERLLRAEDGVFKNPADPGRVRPERRRNADRQALLRKIQIFEHSASRPIYVGAVLKDDIDKGDAEKREAADDLGTRHG